MLRNGISMTLLAVIHRAFRMLNGFSHVFVVSLSHQWQAQKCNRSECCRSTSDADRHGFLLMVECLSDKRERIRN